MVVIIRRLITRSRTDPVEDTRMDTLTDTDMGTTMVAMVAAAAVLLVSAVWYAVLVASFVFWSAPVIARISKQEAITHHQEATTKKKSLSKSIEKTDHLKDNHSMANQCNPDMDNP